jgi:hypothetical protein
MRDQSKNGDSIKFVCPKCGKEAIPSDISMMIECSDKDCHTNMSVPFALINGYVK